MVKRKEANVHQQSLGDKIENPATYGVRVGATFEPLYVQLSHLKILVPFVHATCSSGELILQTRPRPGKRRKNEAKDQEAEEVQPSPHRCLPWSYQHWHPQQVCETTLINLDWLQPLVEEASEQVLRVAREQQAEIDAEDRPATRYGPAARSQVVLLYLHFDRCCRMHNIFCASMQESAHDLSVGPDRLQGSTCEPSKIMTATLMRTLMWRSTVMMRSAG